MLAIATDAHSTGGLAWMKFGITTARRGGCPADRVVNTWPWAKLRKWTGKKR
jgi:histidinol phosphatase-like PHP family hydrolase